MWVLVGTRFSSDNIMARLSRMRLLVFGWLAVRPILPCAAAALLHARGTQPKWLILLLLRAGTEQSRCPSLVLPALVLCWAVHDRVPGAIAPHL